MGSGVIREQVYGGNVIRWYDLASTRVHSFTTDPYLFRLHDLKDEGVIDLSGLRSACIYLLPEPVNTAGVKIVGRSIRAELGDVLLVDGPMPGLALEGGPGKVLVAGSTNGSGLKDRVLLTPANEVYKVTKPWGHELWITGKDHPLFALKKLFIETGHRTSLQYHQVKRETIVLFGGEARIYYRKNPKVPNDEVTADDLGSLDLKPVSSLDVHPQVIHRMEAIESITFYEASTPHLDDVIRVSDDSSRTHGTIATEHPNR